MYVECFHVHVYLSVSPLSEEYPHEMIYLYGGI